MYFPKRKIYWFEFFGALGTLNQGNRSLAENGTFRPKQFIEILSNSINIWNCFQDILPSQLIDSYNLLSPIQNSYLILNLLTEVNIL